MALRIPGMPQVGASSAPPTWGAQRKIGLIGLADTSLRWAPWHDPTWEFWCHASAALRVPKGRCAVYFDQHPPNCFQEGRKNGFRDYYAWLKALTIPIYMQEHYPEIPASLRYPREEIKAEF